MNSSAPPHGPGRQLPLPGGPAPGTIEEAVPADVLSSALYARFRSREKANVADKLLSAMRHGFGGHVEPKTDQ